MQLRPIPIERTIQYNNHPFEVQLHLKHRIDGLTTVRGAFHRSFRKAYIFKESGLGLGRAGAYAAGVFRV